MSRFVVNFSDFTEKEYTSLAKVKDAVLHAHACGVGVDDVQLLDDNDDIIKSYGLEWDVNIVEL